MNDRLNLISDFGLVQKYKKNVLAFINETFIK